MNTEMNSAHTNAITTAPVVVRIVLQISGQAWNRHCGVVRRSPEVKIDWIWLSTFPPGPNQPRPLCENDGHASWKTNTSIASSSPTSMQTSAPSRSSARWS